jgi:hypothetical protein
MVGQQLGYQLGKVFGGILVEIAKADRVMIHDVLLFKRSKLNSKGWQGVEPCTLPPGQP